MMFSGATSKFVIVVFDESDVRTYQVYVGIKIIFGGTLHAEGCTASSVVFEQI